MAHHNLPALSLPDFPQIFDSLIAHQIARVDLVLAKFAGPQLSTCSYESGESQPGAADGQACHSKAVVFDLESEQEYCAKHFQEVKREG